MAQILDGKVVAAKVQAAVAEGVGALRARGVRPALAVVLVGEDPASKVYVGGKRRACQALGIEARDHLFPQGLAQAELLALIRELNDDRTIHGILVQLPLPAGDRRGPGDRRRRPGQGRGRVPPGEPGPSPRGDARASSRAPPPGSSRSSTTTAST